VAGRSPRDRAAAVEPIELDAGLSEDCGWRGVAAWASVIGRGCTASLKTERWTRGARASGVRAAAAMLATSETTASDKALKRESGKHG